MIGRDACGEFMSVSLPCRPLWVIEIVVLHFTFDLDGFCFEALLEEGQSRDIRWLWTQTNSWRRPALCFNCAFGCLYSSVSHRHTHTQFAVERLDYCGPASSKQHNQNDFRALVPDIERVFERTTPIPAFQIRFLGTHTQASFHGKAPNQQSCIV